MAQRRRATRIAWIRTITVAAAAVVCGALGAACSTTEPETAAAPTPAATAPVEPSPTVAPSPTPTTAPTPVPTSVVAGRVVSAADGRPVPGSVVRAGDETALTDASGAFTIVAPDGGELVVDRPAWVQTSVPVPADDAPVEVQLEPMVVRGLRVSRAVVADADRFDDLLRQTEISTVNTLVFDTKDEDDIVQYATDVAFAHDIGAVDPAYDPATRIARAREAGLYTITRIVTFEDGTWADAQPEAALTGEWIDAADPANWAYPLALAEEACELGFDEVQFDYVRFPSGVNAERAWELVPPTEEARAAAIAGFLGEARARLHPKGCGVSAAIFGIVMSSIDDERLGQTPETVSAVVDAISPMVYPSHYSPGWLGFDDPNDHPGPVVAHALDTGGDRVADGSVVRPWIQGFYYNGAQVRAQIDEAEARGAGWIIWNAFGEYRDDWLPPGP